MLFDTRERWRFHQSANSYKLERDPHSTDARSSPSATIGEKGEDRRRGWRKPVSLLEGDSGCREGRIFWAIVREKTRGRRATKGRDRRTQAGLRKGEEGSRKIVGERETHERYFCVHMCVSVRIEECAYSCDG